MNSGGRYVGWRGGTELAATLGLSTAVLSEPTSDVPGSLFRVRVDASSPLRRGVGRFDWVFYDSDVRVMRASSPDDAAVSFPPADSPDWFVSGFQRGAEELGGTAAVIDEPVGSGRTVAFSVEPNFRAFTVGTQRLLRNGVLGPEISTAKAARAGSTRRARAERRARAAAHRLSDDDAALRLTVRRVQAGRAAAALRRLGARYEVRRSRRTARFLIANPRELSAEELRLARRIPGELERARVGVLAYISP